MQYDHFPQALRDQQKTRFEGRPGRRANDARGEQPVSPAIAFDDAVTRALHAAIDSQDPHAYAIASSSFSSTSKLE